MRTDERKDPFLGCNFRVEIDGLTVGGFSEVSGLQVETVVETYREGGLNEYEHKLPGPTRYPSNLVLKHGLMDTDIFWQWYHEVTQGKIKRKSGSIVLRDSAGNEQWRWNFTGAYPVRWTGPDLRANTAEVAIESLELAHTGLTRAK